MEAEFDAGDVEPGVDGTTRIDVAVDSGVELVGPPPGGLVGVVGEHHDGANTIEGEHGFPPGLNEVEERRYPLARISWGVTASYGARPCELCSPAVACGVWMSTSTAAAIFFAALFRPGRARSRSSLPFR